MNEYWKEWACSSFVLSVLSKKKSHLDIGRDLLKVVRRERVRLRALGNLEVAAGGQLNHQVLHGRVGLIDDEDLEHNVVLVHGDERLGVDGVGQTGQLRFWFLKRRKKKQQKREQRIISMFIAELEQIDWR